MHATTQLKQFYVEDLFYREYNQVEIVGHRLHK